MKNKNDFPMLDSNVVYFDNAATSFKPNRVIDKISEYYTSYNANSHRGDYDISFRVDDEVDYLDPDEIAAKLRGEKGTTVKLSVVRDGEELSFDLTREEINAEYITSGIIPPLSPQLVT